MRVIAGIAKGHKLAVPPGQQIRPTADRVREALFSVLGEKVLESKVLDLFAGSGALGIEALSRGAANCILIDNNRKSVQTIAKNLEKTKFQTEAEVIKSNAIDGLDQLIKRGERFDLIFLDPPYKIKLTDLKMILERLSRKELINHNGIVVIEHSSKVDLIDISRLKKQATKKYGDTCLTFYSPA